MQGHGNEFPVTKQRGGYQGHGDVGTTRVITQPRADGTLYYMYFRLILNQRTGTHKFKGVISHDERRPTTHPGYNDHFKLPQRRK